VNNQIKKENLYTIRRGELVRDNITDGLVVTHTELIKIKERDGETRGCVFYDEAGKACTIYAHRPVQCSAFKCWDTDEFMKAYKGPKLMREQVVEDGVLLGLIEEHERRCSYAVLEEHAREIESKGEEVVERILDLLKNLKDEMNSSILLITHDLGIVAGICNDVAVMYAGKIVEYSDVVSVLNDPLHPYTKGLLASIPRLDKGKERSKSIKGSVANPINPPPGCRFHPRCQYAEERCKSYEPEPKILDGSRVVACHLYS